MYIWNVCSAHEEKRPYIWLGGVMSFSLLYPACLLANLNNEEQMLLWRSKALRIQVLAAFYNQKKVWVGSLWKTAKAKRLLVLHFLKRWLRGIHQFSKLINRLKRLCVYFYYGANKSCSRAMWGSRQSDAISFFYCKLCAQYPDFFMMK